MWRTGGNVGVFYDGQVRDWFYLQPRLMLGYQENQFEEDVRNDGLSDFLSQWNVQLPVLASFVMVGNEDFGLRLNVGPYAQYAVFGRDRHVSYTYNPDAGGAPLIPDGTALGWWHEQFGDKFTIGGQVGVQVSYKHLLLNLDYKHSFRKSTLNLDGFENTLLIGVGYKF